MNSLGLYVIITKPTLSYKDIAQICVNKNVPFLQIREKFLTDKELLSVCKDIVSITKNSGTKFIVNDRIDIALLSDADGVHLGQDDLSIDDARKILGTNKIIGLSTHSIEQAKVALAQRPDYIGFGPVFPTITKAVPDPVVGTELLSKVIELADIPVIAIGGIDENNIQSVINAGAKNICAVRYLMNTTDLEGRIDYLNSLL